MKKILEASADKKYIKTVTDAAKNYADTFSVAAAQDTQSASDIISFTFP